MAERGITLDQQHALHVAATRLRDEFGEHFGTETIERFIDTSEYPKPWTDETVRAADVVITIGCGDGCPIFPGKRYEEWELEDPRVST